MGNQHISLIRAKSHRKHASFRRLFIWYCMGILATTFVVAGALESLLLVVIARQIQRNPFFTHNIPVQLTVVALIIVLPFLVLSAAILFFAWLMGRKVSQPVDELMQAVEKIRQQDLDFSIAYQGRNELGELCYAFNELRRELQNSLEREWCKQEEMRTMVAALSHDLRTPVAIIQGHIEGLARAEAGEKRNQRLERYLPVLEASSQRMTRLLNDMLLVATLEQASFLIQPQPVMLEKELARKVQVYTLQAATQDITFTYTYDCNACEKPVTLDIHRVEQVLDNLFENALRYTPAHGTISLTCVRHPHALILSLRDTGSGLTARDLPHVFEKFYRSQEQATGKVHKAAGLGLYICKLLIEQHGGSIAIQNHPDGGCVATFSLPDTTFLAQTALKR